MVRFEWLIIELIVLGLAIFELVRTRRGLRKVREEEQTREAAERAADPVISPDNNNPN